MLTVHKFSIPAQPEFTVDLPFGVEYLDVQIQRGVPVFWIKLDPTAVTHSVKFKSIPTGAEIEEDLSVVLFHVGSFQLQGGDIVMHLFEVMED